MNNDAVTKWNEDRRPLAPRSGRAGCPKCGVSRHVNEGEVFSCNNCKVFKQLVWMDVPESKATWGDKKCYINPRYNTDQS